ncbi:DUF5615 family PIN-like protein [Streptomyces cyaneofuscatus]|uniref:DUF5615 family PIN-like protein n=1 Tax=Streptomyces cyaneofuscatus TaxID=66883 RepID=UPI0033F9374D
MKLLLDENVPRPMADIVRMLLKAHDVLHVHDLAGRAGTKDIELFEKARAEGFDAVLTNDTKQMSRNLEVAAIAASGPHRIEYRQNNKHGGFVGLGAAIATVCAGLPHALAELSVADSQRLVSFTSVDPTRATRVRTVDPRVDAPEFWPTR